MGRLAQRTFLRKTLNQHITVSRASPGSVRFELGCTDYHSRLSDFPLLVKKVVLWRRHVSICV